jgi:hypothetical protein
MRYLLVDEVMLFVCPFSRQLDGWKREVVGVTPQAFEQSSNHQLSTYSAS